MASQEVRLRIVFITLSLMNVDDLSEKMLSWDPKTFGKKKKRSNSSFGTLQELQFFEERQKHRMWLGLFEHSDEKQLKENFFRYLHNINMSENKHTWRISLFISRKLYLRVKLP